VLAAGRPDQSGCGGRRRAPWLIRLRPEIVLGDAAGPASAMKDRRKRTRNKTADYMRPMSACFHAGGLRGGRPERLGSRWRGLFDSIETKQGACALDRNSQKAALAGFSKRASDGTPEGGRRGVLLGRLGSRVHEAATIFSRLLTRLSETELELRCGRAQRCKNSSGAPDTTGHATLSMSSRTCSRGRARTTRGSFANHWKHPAR
jgi:hypothetical protein